MVLTEDGKVVFELERTRTVILNLPDLMMASRTGSPRSPAACEHVSSIWGELK